jgi:predicted house-cleaning noncanonical NTP pyrophosphatase (MazG superfamily)
MKKLIRDKIIKYYKESEFEHITNQKELNEFYALKVYEELDEIQRSDHKDITEFADLIQVAISFANANGFTLPIVMTAVQKKQTKEVNLAILLY